MDPAVVVDVDPLDRRRAALEHARLQVGVEARAQRPPGRRAGTRPPSTSTSGSPCVGSRTASDGCGGLSVTRPCSASISSGVTARARSIISRTAGSCSAICRALLVAERLHVQQERLLDLGVVEQVAAALGRELRVVGQHDRGAEHHVVGRRREHRPGVDAVAAARRAGETKRPPATRSSGCVEISERSSAAARSSPGVGLGAVLDAGTTTQPAAARRAASTSSRGPNRQRRPTSKLARCPRSAAARRGGARRWARGSAPRPSTSRPALDDAAQVEVVEGRVEPGRVGGRVDDPERRRRGVLGRSRRVGVERVALVEQRVDQLAHESISRRRAAPRRTRRASAAPRRAFSRCSARSVVSCSGIQPLCG